jgi:hypothetical protein
MKEIDRQEAPQVEENEDARWLSMAVNKDNTPSPKDIMYVPYDEETGKGGTYEHRDGSPLGQDTIRFMVQVGALF